MKTFRVSLRRTTVESASVIVLAQDEAEAERLAEARGLAGDVWWAEDPRGSAGAVEVIGVDKVE